MPAEDHRRVGSVERGKGARFGRRSAMFLVLGVMFIVILQAVPDAVKDTPRAASQAGNPQDSAAGCSQVPYGKSVVAKKAPVAGEPYVGIPPNASGPALVDVGLFVDQITEVSPVDNTFKIEGALDVVWCDPRESPDPDRVGVSKKTLVEDAAALALNRTWHPDLTLVNEVDARVVEHRELAVYPDGTTEYREKFSAKLEARYDFTKFPFDTQTLDVEVESFPWTAEAVVLHEERNMVGFSTEFQIPEWTTQDIGVTVKEIQEARDRAPFSEFHVEIDVIRDSGFYIWKILLPLVLLVGASWSVFWMTDEGLGARVGLSLVGLLTVVAYQFLMLETVPKVGYFTFWDATLTASFILMALTIPQNVIVRVLDPEKERKPAAVKLDNLCKWAFPLAYVLGLTLLALVYLL